MGSRILLRSGRPPHDTTSNEEALAWYGGLGHFNGNSGNMLFGDAVYKALKIPDATIDCDGYKLERAKSLSKKELGFINDTYDVLVLPLANSFRESFHHKLNNYTNLIKKLNIPVVVIGVGAQVKLGADIHDLNPEHRKALVEFTKTVLDHSVSIGVRGESTKDLLMKLGFSNNDVDVIGCPSLFNTSRDHTVIQKAEFLTADSSIGICTNPYKIKPRNLTGKFYADNEKRYPNISLILQKNDEAKYVIWGKEMDVKVKGLPTNIKDRAYLEGRLRFFTNSQTWYEYMSTLEFFFGPRLHGVIAAINAGTPGFLLTIDSRTQELAQYHGLPSLSFYDAMESNIYFADQLHERADFTEFNKRMPENWDRYYSFLEKNGLEHIHMKGKANPRYEKKLQLSKRPSGAKPITSLEPEDLASRMQWLWQGDVSDAFRLNFAQKSRPEMIEIFRNEMGTKKITFAQNLAELSSDKGVLITINHVKRILIRGLCLIIGLLALSLLVAILALVISLGR